MKKNSIDQSKVLFWNLLGNLSAASVSVIYLMFVSRLTDSVTADKFSLSYSIGNLWVIIGLFQVRNYQGTDVSNKHDFNSYFFARFISTLAMLLTAIPYLLMTGYSFRESSPLVVALVIILYRSTDAWSDLFQGLYQKHERLDIAGRFMTCRYAISVVVFFLGLVAKMQLYWVVFLLFLFNITFIYIYDYRYSLKFETINFKLLFTVNNIKKSLNIIYICIPLFINGFLLNLIFNEPKLVIESGIRNYLLMDGGQRDFNILFMPVFFMSLVVFILRPYITKLAYLFRNLNHKEFDKLLYRIFSLLFIGGIIVVGLSYLLGVEVLTIVFGVDLLSYKIALVILIVGGIFYSLSVIIENILIIYNSQKYLTAVLILVYLFSKVLISPLVDKYKILGAGYSFLILMITYFLGSLLIFIFASIKVRRSR